MVVVVVMMVVWLLTIIAVFLDRVASEIVEGMEGAGNYRHYAESIDQTAK